jgi:hypothetical protein
MAGITVVVSNQPGHPAHRSAEASCAHALRLALCEERHASYADGRVSVHDVAPVHLGLDVDEIRGTWHYAHNLSSPRDGAGNGGAAPARIVPGAAIDGVRVTCDPRTGEVTVESDRFNRHPLFFFRGAGFAGATTEIAPLFRAGLLPFAWDVPGVASSLCWGFPLFPGTLYDGISQSVGGTTYTVTHEGTRVNSTADVPRTETPALDDVLDIYADALAAAIAASERPAVALSGGWDTRATLAVLRGRGLQPTLMTFGVPGSTDLVIAQRAAALAGLPHHVLRFEESFMRAMHEHLALLARSGNGLATPMAAHEVWVNRALAPHFDMLVDSAGCEFRRGHRIQRRIAAADGPRGAAALFLATHETGIRSAARLSRSFLRTAADAEHLLLDAGAAQPTKDDAVDGMFRRYVWDGHYTHSANSQANILLCRMPMYDPSVYAAFLALPPAQRWGKDFQLRAIRRWMPELLRLPVSHGGMAVPARDDFASKLPALLRHRLASAMAQHAPSLTSRIDSYHGHLDYPGWSRAMHLSADLRAPRFMARHAEWFVEDHNALLSHPRTLLTLEYLALIEEASTPSR